PSADVARPGALPVALAPAERSALLRSAQSDVAEVARELDLGSKEKLTVRDVVANADGSVHTRYERTYGGLPVLGGDMVVHRSKSGEVKRVTRATEASIEVGSLEAPAGKKPKASKASGSVAPRKVVWAAGDKPVLAWERVVGGMQEDGTPNELHVITDARTGEKLHEYQAVHNGTGHSQYGGTVQLGTSGSGSSFSLTDAARGNHRTYNLNRGTSGTGSLFTDADDTWGDGTPGNAQTAGVDAHYGAALTWDYFKNVQGRNGVRGDGVAPYSRVHYGNNYVNAFWSDSCFCMTYGDGQNNERPLTSIDVAAHEMTHGLTSNTAGLVYSGESGGLNEATSDIFAAAVEFHAKNGSDVGDYLVGEKIDIRGNGTPLRYMDRPSRDGNSKDAWYSGIGSIDVHYSSGPANHFFYLLSEGSGKKTVNGVAYDSPTSDNQPVTGIGISKAEKIWFKALTEQMTSRSDYADARRTTLIAAAALYGTDSTEHQAVAHAWAAVNVGERPGDPGEPGGDEYENTDDLAIPDNGPAVTSSINVTGRTGNAPSDLKVTVDIRHTYRGDLVLDLVGPGGTTYRLKNSSNDSGDNLNTTYTVNASTQTANGTWRLRVQDVYSRDTGTLNSWKLTF
ncbi:M4 family metallopeptidase, partial [Streptomyces sparsus]